LSNLENPHFDLLTNLIFAFIQTDKVIAGSKEILFKKIKNRVVKVRTNSRN